MCISQESRLGCTSMISLCILWHSITWLLHDAVNSLPRQLLQLFGFQEVKKNSTMQLLSESQPGPALLYITLKRSTAVMQLTTHKWGTKRKPGPFGTKHQTDVKANVALALWSSKEAAQVFLHALFVFWLIVEMQLSHAVKLAQLELLTVYRESMHNWEFKKKNEMLSAMCTLVNTGTSSASTTYGMWGNTKSNQKLPRHFSLQHRSMLDGSKKWRALLLRIFILLFSSTTTLYSW